MPVATKKLRSNRAWIERHINDPFVKRSRQEGYRARSVYKLIELNEKEKLIKPGMCVVDLGAAPGSWTQVVREKLAGKDGEVRGTIIAMDILPMDPIDGVTFLQGDFREQEVADKLTEIIGDKQVDLVLSDMAPNLSGIAAADARGGRDLYDESAFGFSGPVCWIFGAEGPGVSERALAVSDVRLYIPIDGRVESLNVSAAAAVCLFEMRRRRRIAVSDASSSIPLS